jgi:hypothetical protein
LRGCSTSEPLAGKLRGELRRHLSEDLGEVDPRLLEDAAFDQDARPSAAAAGTVPGVFPKARLPVRLLQADANAVLKVAKIGHGARAVGFHDC